MEVDMQATIGKWHESTFPGVCERSVFDAGRMIDGPIIEKIKEEVGEFLQSPSPEEAADIAFALYAWCHYHGVNLNQEIAKKFIIVSNRDQKSRDVAKGIWVEE